MKLLSVELVAKIHDNILENEAGFDATYTLDKLEAVIGRVSQKIYYENLTNPFDIAALYAEAIARGHAFPDANKRTAFVSMLTVLSVNGVFPNTINSIAENIEESTYPVEMMIGLADGSYKAKEVSKVLFSMFVVGGAFYGIIKLIDYFRKD